MADLFGGVTILGHIFNTRKDKTNMENNENDLISNSRLNLNKMGNNLFDNSQVPKNMDLLRKKAKNRSLLSKDPEKTGVYPSKYNKKTQKKNNVQTLENFSDSDDSVFSDDFARSRSSSPSSVRSNGDVNFFNPVHFLDKTDKFDNMIDQIRPAPRIKANNAYSNQFDDMTFDNPSDPVGMGAIPLMAGKNAGSKRLEMERNLALNEGFSYLGDGEDMTFNVVDRDRFTHNNMVPNFKTKGGGSFYTSEHRGMQNQRRLELFTGADNRPDYHSGKEESAPLFSPLVGMTNIYGMPAMTGVFETRYNPGRERRNEKPFQPIKVTKGLGLGPFQQRTTGFVEPVRILPKTIDDIRPPSKGPQISHEGRVVDGQKGSRGPVIGKVIKKKPLKYREHTTKDLVKVYGNNNINPPRINGKIEVENMATKNRGVLRRTQYGPAKSYNDVVDPAKQYGMIEETKKQNFNQADPSNVHLVDGLKSYPTAEPYIPKATQRGQELNYLGPLGNNEHQRNKSVNYYDVPDMTNREMYAETDRTGVITGNKMKSKVINYNDVPDLTLREIFGQTDRSGFMTGNQYKNKSVDYNDIMDLTLRDVFNEYDRAGFMTGNQYKNKSVDYNDIMDLTWRDIHNKFDRAGFMTGNQYKNKSVDYDDVMDVTLRNIHNQYDRTGFVTGDQRKSKVIDYTDVPDMTNREMYADTDRAGNISNVNRTKNKIVDYTDVPNMTNREMYADTDRAGNISNVNRTKNKIVDYTDVPNMTNREMYADTDRAGNISNVNRTKNKIVDYTDVPNMTNREMYADTDRSGNISNAVRTKNKVIDYTDVPNMTNREMYADTDRAGNISNIGRTKNKVVDYTDVPAITNREMTCHTNHFNPATKEVNEPRRRTDFKNALLNESKETVMKGRTPTLIGQNRGHTLAFTEFSFSNNKIIDNQRVNFQNDIPSTNNRVRFEGTRTPKLKWFFNDNEDRKLLKANLDSNPHINNIVHKAVSSNEYPISMDKKFKIFQ